MLEAFIAAKHLRSGEMLLRDISLSAAPGEIVAVLGASGTGKTTLLRILLDLDRRFEGRIRRTAQRMSAVFQEPRLLPWRSVGENIRLVLTGPEDSRHIGRLLEDLALPGTEALYPRQMSLGMARRVALARALATEPDLLVLDEPFASLDPRTADLVAERLARYVRDTSASVVVAMHDIDRAVALATRILVLSGRPATVSNVFDLPPTATNEQRLDARAMLARAAPFVASDPKDKPEAAFGLSVSEPET